MNAIAQTAALAALHDTGYLHDSIGLNRDGMKKLADALSAMGVPAIPSVGNFICANVGRTAPQVYQELLGLGVIVRPVDNYGLVNYLRITIGLPEENERFIGALGQVLGLNKSDSLSGNMILQNKVLHNDILFDKTSA